MKDVTKDDLWKSIIEDFFEDFLYYFFPKWTRLNVDFTKNFEFLDTELAEIAPELTQQTRAVDKLVKVFTKNKSEIWVLVHIEVQDYADKNFGERMFTYFYRIWDRFKKKIMSLAIFTDKSPSYKPDEFLYEYENTFLNYKFDIFKVLEKSEAELNIPGNPFSIIMLTAKKAIERQNLSDDKQLIWKMDLVRELKKANYSNDKIYKILHFIRCYTDFKDKDNYLKLNDNITQTLNLPTSMGIIELLTKTRNEQIEEVKNEGRIEEKIEGIKNLLKRGKLTLEEIAEDFHVTIDFVLEIQKNIKS